HQFIIPATRLALICIVGTHHTGNFCIYHQLPECWKISIPKVMVTYVYIKYMTRRFRPTMNCIVLGTRCRFQIFWVAALQASYKCGSYAGGKKRVFAISFLAAAPS